MPSATTPPLSSLDTALSWFDYIGAKGYVRPLFCFPLTSGASQGEVTRILRDGLEATKEAIPILFAEMVPEEGEQKGRLKFQFGDHGELKVRDLTSGGATFPLTYEELRAKRFPNNLLDGNLLCPTTVFPAPGSRVPVFAAQANFIKGGLILSLSIFHAPTDAVVHFKILQIWAQECRRAQGEVIPPSEVVGLSAGALDKAPILKVPSNKYSGLPSNHPEFYISPSPPAAPPAGLINPSHRARFFHFSPTALATLKADASPTNSTHPLTASEPKWISTNDALSALIWRSVMSARYDLSTLSPSSSPTSSFQICVDIRKRLSPPLPDDWIGCGLAFAMPTMPVRQLLSSATNIADITLAVRRAVLKVNTDHIHDLATMIATKIPDYRCVMHSVFQDILGTGGLITSWATTPVYALDWGEVFGPGCESVRAPDVGLWNGVHWVTPELPKRLGGGLDVMVGLEERHFERLRSDPVWMKYAAER